MISHEDMTDRERTLYIARMDHYIAALYHSLRLGRDSYQDVSQIEYAIERAQENRDDARKRMGRVEPRHRPRSVRKKDGDRDVCYLFLDECGGHETNRVDPKFPVFCLNGLAVSQHGYETLIGPLWNGFKAKFLGSTEVRVHEPSLRRRRLKYWLARHNGYRNTPDEFEEYLDDILSSGDYALISAVIRKDEYQQMFKDIPVDVFLPPSQYHIALDFILERFVHFLHYEAGDAIGMVIAERIGHKEAMQLKHEYSRLQLEGTQYIAPSWFRYQLDENIYFGEKNDLIAGLEITDVAARPIAEKVLDPLSDPVRWDSIKSKFYDGGQNRPQSYGLKVFPTPVEVSIFN